MLEGPYTRKHALVFTGIFLGATVLSVGMLTTGYFIPGTATARLHRGTSNAAGRVGKLTNFDTGTLSKSNGTQCTSDNPTGRNSCSARGYDKAPLVVISFDGFRYSYLDRNLSPTFESLRTCGASTIFRPPYVSISFPSHYSMATGLYLESHGIIDNKMYDPEMRRSWDYKEGDAGPNSDPGWWKGEPIWVTAKKQGKKVRTYYWPGNEVLIQGYRADEWFHYNHSDSLENRLERVLNRLLRPTAERPDLIMLYYDQPDAMGHLYGSSSPEVNKEIANVDRAISHFVQGLQRHSIFDCVNLIVVSDHGMEDALCNRSIDLISFIARERAKGTLKHDVTDEDFHLRGHTEGGMDSRSPNITNDMLYDTFSCKEFTLPNSTKKVVPFMLYKKEDMPRRFHYTNSPRIEPLILNVKPGYTVFQHSDPSNFCHGGRHGYDNVLETMEGLFIGHGPAFKSGVQTEPLVNIELYNLMCELLSISPAPNNGTEGSMHSLLQNPKTLSREKYSSPSKPVNPSTSHELRERRNLMCLQKCSKITGRIPQADMRFVHSEQEQDELLQRHGAGMGLPQSYAAGNITALSSSFLVAGLSSRTKLPAWVAASVDRISLNRTGVFEQEVTCARSDIRVSQASAFTCMDYDSDLYSPDVVPAYLFPPGLSDSLSQQISAMVITNIVPMFRGFLQGVWGRFWKMVANWNETVHVQMGPVFDSNLPYGVLDDVYVYAEELADSYVPLPSHYFVVLTKNRTSNPSKKSPMKLTRDVISFILPHRREKTHACQSDEEYFFSHSAAVRDVELITGLRFLTELPSTEGTLLRVHQPTSLWSQQKQTNPRRL